MTKLFKVGVKLAKTGNAVEGFADNIQDFGTLVSPGSTPVQRVIAGASLLSEFAPISAGDVKDGLRLGEKATSWGKAMIKRYDDAKRKVHGNSINTGQAYNSIPTRRSHHGRTPEIWRDNEAGRKRAKLSEGT